MTIARIGQRNMNKADNSNSKCPGLAPTVGLNSSVAAVYKKRIGCCGKCVISMNRSTAYGCSVGCTTRRH
jgi:hypothetical protein